MQAYVGTDSAGETFDWITCGCTQCVCPPGLCVCRGWVGFVLTLMRLLDWPKLETGSVAQTNLHRVEKVYRLPLGVGHAPSTTLELNCVVPLVFDAGWPGFVLIDV